MVCKPEPTASLTPMMQQYFAAKEKYPSEIIFFRMGDFYEMFFDDAVVAAEILGIALTSRSKDKDGAIPMAGVPVRAVDSYLPKLLRAGKRVAICEQVQDPREARGLLEREVIRVISPGTVTDEKLIGAKSNNYLAALVRDGECHGIGLGWLDLSTGHFQIWESSSLAAVAREAGRLSPAEFVLPESLAFALENTPALKAIIEEACTTPYPDALFERRTAYRTLVEHFRTQTLDGFGCEHLSLGIRAGGGLLRYLADTQKVALKHITRVEAFQEGRFLPLDRATRRALELTETARGGEKRGTLLHVLDRTATAAGGRLLRDWLLAPLTSVEAIRERQDAVGAIAASCDRAEQLAGLLRQVHDLERICTRISYGSANARDLLALGRTLEVVPRIKSALAELAASSFLERAASRLAELHELRERLTRAIVDEPPLAVKEGGLFRAGCNAELDELRAIAREGRQWIARFQQKEIERTAIASLKVGFNKVFGYYIEVTNTHRERIPAEYIRKQTLKNCERFITPELKEYENKVLHAKERSLELEYDLLVALREEAAAHIPALQETAAALAAVDVITALGSLARERGYVRPLVGEGTRLAIEDGRHPAIEELSADPFIPNSIDLDGERSLMIITGPNMAGKSTYIRQVALLVLLAQMGSFIPARRAEIGVVDRLFTRIGASDDLARGQSTFMVEMNETANILNNATRQSLIILDEVGRGTSTFDGLSLAWAITEHIAEHIGARTLFATHYHELTSITRSFPCAGNFNFAVKEWKDDIIFLRKLVEGAADKSYGIHVARLAGIPRAVIDRAKEVLANLENQSLDIEDQPALARRAARSAASRGGQAVQLDFFQNANEALLKELKRLDTDRMTPLEALEYLAELRKRIV
jgi:DNA mismatch repair protein MutS